MGPRGDAIVEFDWSVGQILNTLEKLGLTENTLIILTSDNGPVVDDGYKDEAVERLGSHKPAGIYRGGKYSSFEAGTRIPFIISWSGKVKPGTSSTLISQMDLFGSLARLTGQPIPENAATDSYNSLDSWLGQTDKDRDFIIQESLSGTLSIVSGNWKYITPSRANRIDLNTNIELGQDTIPQLYNLLNDAGERKNISGEYPDKVKELSQLLDSIK